MRKSTHTRVGEIIQLMNNSFIVDFIDANDDIYTVYTCNTLWMVPSKERVIIIDGNPYKVLDVSPFYTSDGLTKPFVILQGGQPIVVTDFNVPLPVYYHGTILRVNEELNQVPLSWNKTPMFYLRGETTERWIEDGQPGDANELESDCMLYAMTEANYTDWTGAQHELYAVAPMRNMMSEFMSAAKKHSSVGLIEKFNITDKLKWGVYEKSKGNVQNIFNEFLSGVENDITIPWTRNYECCTN